MGRQTLVSSGVTWATGRDERAKFPRVLTTARWMRSLKMLLLRPSEDLDLRLSPRMGTRELMMPQPLKGVLI